MDSRTLRRRALWIGLASVLDLRGDATRRRLQQLGRETAPPPPRWSWGPPQVGAGTSTNSAGSGTSTVTWS